MRTTSWLSEFLTPEFNAVLHATLVTCECNQAFLLSLLDYLLLFIREANCQMLRFCSCISYSFHPVISYLLYND
uniref:Uncharacterized protein n=1 Tax=Arundo donax TaxID=35708 RepID=A0A0A9HGT8_ARUDO